MFSNVTYALCRQLISASWLWLPPRRFVCRRGYNCCKRAGCPSVKRLPYCLCCWGLSVHSLSLRQSRELRPESSETRCPHDPGPFPSLPSPVNAGTWGRCGAVQVNTSCHVCAGAREGPGLWRCAAGSACTASCPARQSSLLARHR